MKQLKCYGLSDEAQKKGCSSEGSNLDNKTVTMFEFSDNSSGLKQRQ